MVLFDRLPRRKCFSNSSNIFVKPPYKVVLIFYYLWKFNALKNACRSEYSCYYEKIGSEVKNITEEIPFEIPKTWSWCRFEELFIIGSSKRVLQSEWRDEGVPFYRAREIAKLANEGYVNNDLFISQEHYQSLKTNYGVPQEGDLMITGVGTIGKAYIVKPNDIFYYKDASVLCFQNRYGAINSQYTKYLLESDLLQTQIHTKTYGNTVDTITISTANKYLCILPPIQEQTRIVKMIELIIQTLEKSLS